MRSMIFILIISSILFACNPWKMVFTNTTALAVEQDSLISIYHRGGRPSYDTLRDLKINYWVFCAAKTAPNNLVIRQYCLIDLFDSKMKHASQIYKMVNILSGEKGDRRVWAEGYSYWTYSKIILVDWCTQFAEDSLVRQVRSLMTALDQGFGTTAYKRNLIYYPAPYADLWDVPLDKDGVRYAETIISFKDTVRVGAVTRVSSPYSIGVFYHVDSMPCGLNGHCDKHSCTVHVQEGVPTDFKFYQGYDEKYKDAEAEWKDLLDPVRLLTLPFIW